MSVSSTRSALYKAAKLLGDYQAVRTGSPAKVAKRVQRRVLGRLFGQILRSLTR